MVRFLIAALLLLVPLVGIGCGDDEGTTDTVAESSTTSTETTTTVDPADSENVNLDYGALPDGIAVDEPEGTPPPSGGSGDLDAAADAAGCELQLDLADEGNEHFSDEEEVQTYDTSPPTSGPHFFSARENGAGALADGAFLDTPPAARVVHSLEHGRVAIQYSPDLPEEDQLAIKGVFDDGRPGVLLFPNAEIPGDVAVSAWRQLLTCDIYGEEDLTAIAAFRDEFRGRGPEAVIF